MYRLLFVFFAVRVFAQPIDDLTPSAPEEIASLRTDLLIGGLINPFSGQIACSEKDLHIHAAQELILQRSYVPPLILGRYEDKNRNDRFELAKSLGSFKGWSSLSHLWCGYNGKSRYFQVLDPGGCILEFQLNNQTGTLVTDSFGMSNYRNDRFELAKSLGSFKGWSSLSHLWCGYNGKSRYFQVLDPGGCILEFQLNNQTGTLVTDSFGMSNLRGEEPCSDADWRNTKLFVNDAGARVQTPNGTERIYRRIVGPSYRLEQEILSNGNSLGAVCRIGDQSIEYDKIGRLIGGSGFRRSLDAFGNILKEEFENGLCIESKYDEHDRPLERILPDQSKIVYEYNPLFLERIRRFSPDGRLLYTHSYDLYSDAGDLLLEDQRTSFEYDLLGRETKHCDAYLTENYSYDPQGNLIQKGTTVYSYDALSQMTSESDRFTAQYDPHYNCIEMNGRAVSLDAFNQIAALSYDANGRLLSDGYAYDIRNRLVAIPGETLSYDVIGRRLTKGSASYLYLGDEEIGSYENGCSKELQVPGLGRAAAIEKDYIAYLPIYDVQGTIRYLVDRSNLQIAEENDSDAFGRGINPGVPYAYAGKRFDPATGLIYFGQRYYDLDLGRWLTQDSVGPADSSNLYQYVFNNPFAYKDPDGQFAFVIPFLIWGAEFVLPTLSACVAPIIYGAVTGAVVYGGYQLTQALNENRIPWTYVPSTPVLSDFLYQSNYSYVLNMNKEGSVDPSLPVNPDDLAKKPGWKETTHPSAGKEGHRTFENEKTGETLRHDEGKPDETGHKGKSHWHRYNPNSTSSNDEYLDATGKPTPRNSPSSHLYPSK